MIGLGDQAEDMDGGDHVVGPRYAIGTISYRSYQLLPHRPDGVLVSMIQ